MPGLPLKCIVPFLCFCCLSIRGGTQKEERLNRNITNLDVVKHSFHIILKTGNLSVPNILSEDWYGNGCSHAKVQMNTIDHITSLRVFNNKGKELRCPVSAWSDLGKINTVDIVLQKEGCKLIIDGGDGGVGYQAVLWFFQDALIKRKVSDGLGDGTDKDAFENTAYRLGN